MEVKTNMKTLRRPHVPTQENNKQNIYKQKQKKKCNGYNKPTIFLIFYRKKDVTRAMQVKGKPPNLKSILQIELENNSSFLVILVRFCRSDRKCAEKLLSERSGFHEDTIRSSLIFSFWQSLRLLKELRKFIYMLAL